MIFDEVMHQLGVNPEAHEWLFALKQIYVNLGIDKDKLNCLGGQQCRFAQKSIRGSSIISERDGYYIGTTGGLLIICPAINDMPITIMLDRKQIRVVEAESKLLKAAVIVKTNDELFEFKVPKKQLSAAEKLVNKVRNA